MERLARRALVRAGDLYSLEDIIVRLADGRMQQFVQGESWLVTQVVDYPRARVLEFFLVVGSGPDLVYLEDQAVYYAISIGATQIRAFGRPGWAKAYLPNRPEWRRTADVFTRDV
jgi:hypothetical protein